MDTPITRAEHEAFSKLMESENKRLSDENDRQNKRLEILEDNSKQLTTLATAVEKLALSIENMAKEQASQGERLETLESRDGEKWRQVTSYVVTTLISLVLGYIFAHLGL
ncbi:MAG: hypothetical protein NC489_17595 [Ruminococcus flavefaciens]|nr:hypothetical protein [Ruminococcus flavefaciens]